MPDAADFDATLEERPAAIAANFARSASNHTDDWAYWFVADRDHGNLNVVNDLVPQTRGCLPFLSRYGAEMVAAATSE